MSRNPTEPPPRTAKPPPDDPANLVGGTPPPPPPNPGPIPPHILAGQREAFGPGFPVLPQQLAQAQLQVWQGQYPPPDAIERYEKVLPGSFDRMISMAEQLQKAQIDESARVVEYNHNASKRGHYLGAGTMVIAMGCALGALYLGNGWVAGAFLALPVMGVAKSLVDSARARPESAAPSIAQQAAVAAAPSAAAN